MPLRRVLSTSWAPVIVTALFTIALLLRYDVGVLDVVVYAVYFALGISLPGVLAWRMLLAHLHTDEPDLDEADPGEGAGAEDEVGEDEDEDRPGPTWFEDLSLGTIFGFGLQLPFYLLGVAIGVPLLVVILPVAAIAVSFTALGRRTWSLPTGSVDVRAAWAMSITMIYGLAWLGRNVFSRRPLDLPLNKPPSIDETFHQALVSELANRFPPRIPFLIDTPLDYHWFVHAQIAAADHSTGVDSITMLREVMPAVSLILSVAGLGAVALRLTRRPLAAAVAPALLVMGVYQLMGPHYDTWQFLEPFMSRRFVWSPSQSYGVVMSTPALMLILEVLRPGPEGAPPHLGRARAGPLRAVRCEGDVHADLLVRGDRGPRPHTRLRPSFRPHGGGPHRTARRGQRCSRSTSSSAARPAASSSTPSRRCGQRRVPTTSTRPRVRSPR